MNVWMIATTVLLVGLLPCLWVAMRGTIMSALAALELASTITTLALLMIAQGLRRDPFMDLALVSAILSFAGRPDLRPLPGALGVSVGDVAVAVLLALGVASALMGALGLVASRNPYDQLHFTGPATVIGPVAIAAAVLVEEPLSSAGIKAVLVALIMVATGPILLHATARAARIREHGRWVVLPEELKTKEGPSKSSRP